MSDPISVVIPTYNRKLTLGRAIDSVLAQSLPAHEIWVVDDGSTDQTIEWLLQNYSQATQSGQIRWIQNKQNLGVSASRNKAVRSSTGDWIAFLDSDDEWLPHKLEKQLEVIRMHPHLQFVHGEEIWIRNGHRVNPMKKHKKQGGHIFKHCIPLCCISPSTSLIRNTLFEDLGLFREDYPVCEDFDLWLKLTSQHEVGFVEEPIIVKHGGHEDQLSKQYKAMDYWRVKSLVEFIESPFLTKDEQQAVTMEIIKKSNILIQGYIKHNNLSSMNEVEYWLKTAQKSLIL